jgi:lipopolysaccharide heptosyltransferase I
VLPERAVYFMPLVDLTSDPRRILLIKPSAIGDVVHTLPILKLVRKRWPAAHIAWLVTPGCAGLLEGHPDLSEVILFDRRRFGRGWRDPKSLLGLAGFSVDLRRAGFDLVVDLQGLFRSGWFTWLTQAPQRVGFASAREFAPLFYTHRVDVGDGDQHAIDRYLKLARAIGCEGPVQFEFALRDEDRAAARKWVGHDRPYAVLLPGTNWETKRWPVEKFAMLVEPLKQRFGLETVVAGGRDDVALGEQIGGVNLAGKTSIQELVALLQGAALVIGNDSGPAHIAAAMERPLVMLFGPTNPLRTGPYGRMESVLRIDIPCSPCYSRKCSHQSCLRWLEIEPVLALAGREIETAGKA